MANPNDGAATIQNYHALAPLPYTMCSLEECRERQVNKEVSIFECEDTRAPMKQRRMDPTLAVAKYRRSAAGSHRQYPCRSLKQLEMTMDHLMELLVTQQVKADHPRQPLLDTVQFVEDRLRAVQVELVISRIGLKKLQRRMARCQILILYLMVDSLDYQHTFGQKALSTALSSYWDSEECDDATSQDDEMLALSTLVALNAFLQNEHDPTTTKTNSYCLQDVYNLYNKHVPSSANTSSYPLFQWSLKLMVDVQLGFWHIVLRRLREGCSDFDILARCCLARSVPYLQFMALKVYNASFGKGEVVSSLEVIRLLKFASDDYTLGDPEVGFKEDKEGSYKPDSNLKMDTKTQATFLEFAVGLGLPLHSDHTSLIFKSAPLDDLSSCSPSRNDAFVFGKISYELDSNGLSIPLTSGLRALIFPEP